MINHFLMTLYNQVDPPPADVLNPLQGPLREPGAIRQALAVWRGDNPWDFAVSCTKIVDGSTFQSAITEHDTRITYDLSRLSVERENMLPFIQDLRTTQQAAVTQVLFNRPDLLRVYRHSDLVQESAAALIVGVVRFLTETARA